MSAAKPPVRPGPGAARARLAEILRVDHAGELGAVAIYKGQAAVFGAARRDIPITHDLVDMQAHEEAHLAGFDALLTEHRVRPTVLTPLWRAAGFVLGAGTALMGEKAAHACTEAVESVIERHYAEQVEELRDSDPALSQELARYRDDELAHRDHAVEHGAREAPGYRLLSAVIGVGCRAAIKLAEKI
jgi:3-demethoxyubiquinol 3-hydroxylase